MDVGIGGSVEDHPISGHRQSHIVIGMGEVGRAIHAILSGDPYDVYGLDIEAVDHIPSSADVLHICLRWCDGFMAWVCGYLDRFHPELVIIHSTVPVGTTRRLGEIAVHSPIEGLHPHLEESIRTFEKHFGGERAAEAARIFKRRNISVILHNKPETTELAKLLSTSSYGIDLLKSQEQAQICRRLGLSYKEVVQDYSASYNAGYATLDHSQFVRPILSPPQGPIGGHCVIPNAKIIKDMGLEGIEMHRRLADFNG